MYTSTDGFFNVDKNFVYAIEPLLVKVKVSFYDLTLDYVSNPRIILLLPYK